MNSGAYYIFSQSRLAHLHEHYPLTALRVSIDEIFCRWRACLVDMVITTGGIIIASK